ncbi:MAG: hypothetical protein JW751_13540 [Polyangiaceae bacterium]|nr:hypothetical protein [Polyangiaceae bacterium]
MYRQEVNERSPMRVFEKSMHSGLGRGNLGVVAAAPGVGKTPLLVQIALDNLLRDRRVLHVSHMHAVDHVRAFYSAIFHELSVVAQLADPDVVMLEVERHRLIFSLMGSASAGQSTDRAGTTEGGPAPIDRIVEVVRFAQDVAHFQPDVIIVDGFDLVHGLAGGVARLKDLARVANAEVWTAASTDESVPTAGGLPTPLESVQDLLDVVVGIESAGEAIRLRLLKDHDSVGASDLHLRLDPHTMRVIDEDVRAPSDRPRDARRFRLVSGGCKGAEAEFGACAERWGITEVNFTYPQNPQLARRRGLAVLTEEELGRGEFSLVYASRRLNRQLTRIPFVRHVLQAIWHQITTARQVFAVGVIQNDDTVKGGTGWGVELARLWNKPLFVFDQDRRAWYRWSGTAWELAPHPVIVSERFAGIGTQTLSEAGRTAIYELFRRSFGVPSDG